MVKRKNKRGWAKIIEAVTAVLLIALFLLFVLDQRASLNEDEISEDVFDFQNRILREIQLNDSMRSSILSSLSLSTLNETFPSDVENFIEEKIPENLNCEAKICNLTEGSACYISEIDEYVEKDIYVRKVLILSDLDTYDPKQLKLFCWLK